MPSELDRKFDAVLAAATGPEGRVQFGTDPQGRAIVTNLPATLPLLFDAFCMLHAETTAIVAEDERLTFADLGGHATRVAKALVGGFGIGKGDRVAIAMRNAPAWIVTYMAVLKAGGVATLINGWWQPHELDHALRLADPKLVIADVSRAKKLEATGLGPAPVVLPVDRHLDEALAPLLARSGDAVLPDVAPEDDATILFTSGSTGAAKGALSTHRAVTTGVYAYAVGLITLLGILESEGRPPANPPKTLVNVPLFHVTGEIPVLLNSFVIGRGMVLMSKWDAGEALRLIEKEKITYFVGVPTMSLELMQHPDRTKYDLSSLTDIAAGGAPRPVSHVGRLRESFGTAQPALGYGLTETNAVGCSNFWSNYADKPSSTGRPQRPIVELAILGPGDVHLPHGERGEIGIRSAANIKGYWRDPAATAAAFTADGFFRTGDVGYLDEDDYLFIVDRLKDIIIRGGENISSQEVEASLYAHPSISEASVFGVADERLGEVPAAVVYSERDSGLTMEGLLDFLGARLAAFKLPAYIWFQDAPLPKLGTGKIDRITLRERYRRELDASA
ncbi:class I adenylate-forming enzyme family protein [Sphingosinicella rhizophila]|uniref:Class I adenylate-forming enzyme family protein n=1 Tax=Sphingosinicella rhizophila TaxID=3050082 RepID=A0ABU3Q796_9SPHN|nr:class I adenylate-forming enzyme family protein [Sphingosinicella sp. GR2756]MDT9599283.1 class I adenylate-forming enzyme family protein [Sphingosinicella sp. GR2756]